jgi:2,4-dienoyl-CoA reductase (NADPH2)
MPANPSTLTHVWTPLTIGHTTVKNRILMPAETIVYAENHIISDRHIAYYRERALVLQW